MARLGFKMVERKDAPCDVEVGLASIMWHIKLGDSTGMLHLARIEGFMVVRNGIRHLAAGIWHRAAGMMPRVAEDGEHLEIWIGGQKSPRPSAISTHITFHMNSGLWLHNSSPCKLNHGNKSPENHGMRSIVLNSGSFQNLQSRDMALVNK
jgi:hypothetical protein